MPSATLIPPDPAPEPEVSARRRRTTEDILVQSALLHAIRASVLRIEVERTLPQRGWRGMLSGQAGHRLRFAALLVRRTLRSLVEDGPAATAERIRVRLLRRGAQVPAAAVRRTEAASDAAPVDVYQAPIGEPAARRLTRRVLIIAELSLPQCAKYRVWQKQAHFERLAIPCTVIDWRRLAEAKSALQTHTLAILYRVPGYPEVLALVEEATRLGVETIWEVDDLIFDVALYGQAINHMNLRPSLRRILLEGAVLFRRAMLATDRTVASTTVLATLMAEATGKPSDVVENALDAETLRFAEDARRAAAARARTAGGNQHVVIVYGSGTNTHDADFAVAAPALLRLLRDDPRIVLRIVGELTLADDFRPFAERVERVPFTDFKAYLAVLAAADIAIAPLENTIFNDAKSNIKLIEAAVVGLPSVCSPRREFRDCVEHGVDGFLAETDTEWFDALRTLADDAALRARIGDAVSARIRARYAPAAIATTQVAPLVGRLATPRRAQLRILVVNIYFAPHSFGGATIVAEEMARRLNARDDTEVFVFTSHDLANASQYKVHRYRARGLDIIGVALRGDHDDILVFDDPEMGRGFADVLRAIAPDIVHFHSIQHFGAAIVRACQLASIPYVVTLHDAWWLCQRQFMVRADNTYCHQTTIDLNVCKRCLPAAHHLQSRMDILMQGLDEAALLLSPSASHAALYRANGIARDRIRVNRNGVRRPVAPRPPRLPGPLRFGYVGGNEKLKGVALIREAFQQIARRDWTLVLVDNKLNLGFSSFDRRGWRLQGKVEIVPAYTQDNMDTFFSSIDVLLFPSQWKESFGLTVREALVRDVWVIATDSGGAAEDIVEGVNGNVVPLGDAPGPLVEAITAVLGRADTIRSHVNPFKGRITTFDDQADELHAILAGIAARASARRVAQDSG
jgi:glycosyltransferase involved in cell wall biosynthesis